MIKPIIRDEHHQELTSLYAVWSITSMCELLAEQPAESSLSPGQAMRMQRLFSDCHHMYCRVIFLYGSKHIWLLFAWGWTADGGDCGFLCWRGNLDTFSGYLLTNYGLNYCKSNQRPKKVKRKTLQEYDASHSSLTYSLTFNHRIEDLTVWRMFIQTDLQMSNIT